MGLYTERSEVPNTKFLTRSFLHEVPNTKFPLSHSYLLPYLQEALRLPVVDAIENYQGDNWLNTYPEE